MKRLVLTALLGLATQWLSAQETYYIKVDPGCMDRFEYHINGESTGTEFITYRIRQGDKSFIFLEVASESTGSQLSAPPVTDCRTLSLSSNFVDKVNKHEINISIVRKDEIGYNISPVSSAVACSFLGSVVKYRSYDTDFQADINYASNEVNLTDLDATNEIFAGGSGGNACLKEYYFQKVSKESCKPSVGLVYIPEIGIVKEITGKSNLSQHESTLNLVRINDVSVETYLASICEKNQAQISMSQQYAILESDLVMADPATSTNSNDVETVPTSYEESNNRFSSDGTVTETVNLEEKNLNLTSDKTVAAPVVKAKAKREITTPIITETVSTVVENTPEPVLVTSPVITKPTAKITSLPTVVKCKDVATKDFHVIQQGESLYGIARRYGLRVDQLQEWNQMGVSALISPCAKLRILPTEEMTIAPKSYETQDLLVAKGGDETSDLPAWKATKVKIHEVKKGDSYYALSQKYGYTLDRFLEMNGITDENGIKIGQKLQVSDCSCPADSKFSKAAPKPYETSNLTPKGLIITNNQDAENKDKKEDKKVVKSPVINYQRKTIHIVTEDETIKSIAEKHGLSVETLAQINYLDANEILIPKQSLFVD